jgi:hypothetical protein
MRPRLYGYFGQDDEYILELNTLLIVFVNERQRLYIYWTRPERSINGGYCEKRKSGTSEDPSYLAYPLDTYTH